VFKRVQSRAQRDFIVERMDSAVALLTDVNPNIEFFSIKAPAESLTAAPLSIFASGVIIRCLMSLQQ
jgi:hypothetical protein